ncbi:MAG: GAF domain-containing protein [Alphaproteobacteria bacterium]|nr:GAF domain-containing protein [Alphaproteobacteria bacterium]
MSLSSSQRQRLAAADTPATLFAAIATAAADAMGCALFTVMRFDAAAGEVERLHSTNAEAYPVGGRKAKRDTPWATQVLGERRVFVGAGDAAIRGAFDDHEKIRSLGLHSIINVPVVVADTCVGTVNFLMFRDIVAPADIAVAEELGRIAAAAFPVPEGSPS